MVDHCRQLWFTFDLKSLLFGRSQNIVAGIIQGYFWLRIFTFSICTTLSEELGIISITFRNGHSPRKVLGYVTRTKSPKVIFG